MTIGRNPTWPDACQGAVSLTYDDGIPDHFEIAAPILEANGLRGTFYVPISRAVMDYSLHWREMAARGHELGNHGAFHPCRDRNIHAWLNPAYDLLTYNEARWLDEMALANFVLSQVDGQTERTFGNTCWDNYIGLGDSQVCLETLVPRLFPAARGEETNQPVDLAHLNFNNLGTVWGDEHTFAQLKDEIERVVAAGGWVIYTFHGVGNAHHSLYIEQEEHRQLVEWLGKNTDRIWTAPVIEVVKLLKK